MVGNKKPLLGKIIQNLTGEKYVMKFMDKKINLV